MLVPGWLRKRCGREKHIPYTKGLHTVLVRMSPCSDPPSILRFGHMRWQASKHPCVRRNCPGEHLRQIKSEKSRTDYNRIEQNISQPNRVHQSRVKYNRSLNICIYVYIYIYIYIWILKNICIYRNASITKNHHIWEGPEELGEGPGDLWEEQW